MGNNSTDEIGKEEFKPGEKEQKNSGDDADEDTKDRTKERQKEDKVDSNMIDKSSDQRNEIINKSINKENDHDKKDRTYDLVKKDKKVKWKSDVETNDHTSQAAKTPDTDSKYNFDVEDKVSEQSSDIVDGNIKTDDNNKQDSTDEVVKKGKSVKWKSDVENNGDSNKTTKKLKSDNSDIDHKSSEKNNGAVDGSHKEDST